MKGICIVVVFILYLKSKQLQIGNFNDGKIPFE
jgi:hypothetical protein